MRTVAAEYEDFLADTAPTGEADPKAFAARHAAGRSALAHLEQLQKLARGAAPSLTAAETLIDAARRALAEETQPDESATDE